MSFPDHGRVLFTATLVRGHIAKFHIPYLKWFKEQGWETWVAARNDYPDGVCEIPFCDHFVNIDFARSPFSMQTFVAYKQLRKLFAKERFAIVHTHTPVGGVLTRLAVRDARRSGTKVIYTAHGFHFYDGAPLINWVLWYPVEREMSRFTDALVTINDEDYRRAQQFAHCRVEYVPGVGVDLDRFVCVKNCAGSRAELGLGVNDYVLLSVGDLNENKNHGVLIEALAKLPDNFKLLVAGEGPLRSLLLKEARHLGVDDRLMLLGFRNDVAVLLNACDLFCFPSKREGLPVSLIEAMACGTPCLASGARGCADVLGPFAEGSIVEGGADEWARAIERVAGKRQSASAWRKQAKKFDISAVLRRMTSLYA